MLAINYFLDKIHTMEPNGIGVKTCVAIPLIGDIVLFVKEKQLFKLMYDQWKIVDSLHTQALKLNSDPQTQLAHCIHSLDCLQNFETPYTNYNNFVSTMNYGFIPRIMLIVAPIFLSFTVSSVLVTTTLLVLTIIPQFKGCLRQEDLHKTVGKQLPLMKAEFNGRIENIKLT